MTNLKSGDIITSSLSRMLHWIPIPYKVERPVHRTCDWLIKVEAPDGSSTVIWNDGVRKCGIWGKTVYAVLKMWHTLQVR